MYQCAVDLLYFRCLEITVYTDGSCHTQLLIGAWVCIVFIGENRIDLSGVVTDTTHNRMELVAVIESLKFIKAEYPNAVVVIFTDSQYVVGLRDRRNKIQSAAFTTKAGNEIQNVDLVRELWSIEDELQVNFIKVAAHLKKTDKVNHNLEADRIVRGLLRKAVAAVS